MISIEFFEYDLPNGLHVIMNPGGIASVAAVDVWYHVGSKNENPSRTGFAHLFEHMMFQGSANVGKAEHMKYIERAGGVFNGSTTWDRTNYFERIPSNQLELALWLESDRMRSLDISRRNLDNQREVVKEERRFRIDNKPYGTAWEKIFLMAYERHPYRWPVIGSMEHLNAATVRELREFFRKHYAPNNAVLAVSGIFDTAHCRKLVQKYFGDIPPGPGTAGDPVHEPPLKRGVRSVVYDDVPLPAVYMAFRVPSMRSADSYALNLAGLVLSQGKSSRLYRKLVYEKKIAQSVYAFQLDMEDPGLFVAAAVVSPGAKPEDVEAEIVSELRKLGRAAPRPTELEKTRNQFSSDWVKGLAGALGRADTLAHFRTFYGDTGMINRYLDMTLRVSAGEVSDAADRYLDTTKNVTIYYMPEKR